MFEHEYPFHPIYGYDESALLQVGLPDAPDDFASVWRATFDANSNTHLDTVVTPIDSPRPDYNLGVAEFDTLGGCRVVALAVYPKADDIKAGFVTSHGYGGRTDPDFALFAENAAAIFPCAPGFNLSATDALPPEKMGKVVHGIEDRTTYTIRPCVSSIWSATSLLIQLFPSTIEQLYFTGGSFGSGLGALAIPWDNRFSRAFLKVPTFGHHTIRNTCPCEDSGQAIAEHVTENPEAMKVLAYYDAATTASHIDIPVFGAPCPVRPQSPTTRSVLRYKCAPFKGPNPYLDGWPFYISRPARGRHRIEKQPDRLVSIREVSNLVHVDPGKTALVSNKSYERSRPRGHHPPCYPCPTWQNSFSTEQ